jgi:hypothetical protein
MPVDVHGGGSLRIDHCPITLPRLTLMTIWKMPQSIYWVLAEASKSRTDDGQCMPRLHSLPGPILAGTTICASHAWRSPGIHCSAQHVTGVHKARISKRSEVTRSERLGISPPPEQGRVRLDWPRVGALPVSLVDTGEGR